MTNRELLEATRARLTPETWGQAHQLPAFGARHQALSGATSPEAMGPRECLMMAVATAGQGTPTDPADMVDSNGDVTHLGAIRLLRRALRQIDARQNNPVDYNDARGRTLDEIHALLTRAIALADVDETNAP